VKFCRIEVFPTRVGYLAFGAVLVSGWIVFFTRVWATPVRFLAALVWLLGAILSWRYRGKPVHELVWRESRQWRLQFADGSSVDGPVAPPLLTTSWLVGAVLRVEGHGRVPFLIARWQTRSEDWPLLLGLLRHGR